MLGKLFCVVGLASAALAQSISFISPPSGTQVQAGSSLTLQLERHASSDPVLEVALFIGASGCFGGPCTNQGVGNILYNSTFRPQRTDSSGNAYQTITLKAPDWTNGNVELGLAHFYFGGPAMTHVPMVQLDHLVLNISGATG